MLILSFDCAIKNLGICLIEFDNYWYNKVNVILKSDILNIDKLKKIDIVLSNIINIKWINVIDLIPDKRITDHVDKTYLLKSMLLSVDKTLSKYGNIDIVLVEYQMAPNDKCRAISAQIVYHYSGYGGIDVNLKKSSKKSSIKSSIKSLNKHSITYANAMYPMEYIDISKKEVYVVGPSLKNKFDLCIDGRYCNFAMKYSTNYKANKEHAVFNFKYFLNIMKKADILDNINNKISDIADAFMMTYAWLMDKGLII